MMKCGNQWHFHNTQIILVPPTQSSSTYQWCDSARLALMSEWAAQPEPRTNTIGLLLCREIGWPTSPLLACFMPFFICAVMLFLFGSFFRVRLAMSEMSPSVSPSFALMVSVNSYSAGHSVKAGASG